MPLPLVVPEVVVLIFFCPDAAFVAYLATWHAESFVVVAVGAGVDGADCAVLLQLYHYHRGLNIWSFHFNYI